MKKVLLLVGIILWLLWQVAAKKQIINTLHTEVAGSNLKFVFKVPSE